MFALADASGGYFFHVVRANKTQYMQVIQFPELARAQATAVRDDFQIVQNHQAMTIRL